MRNLYFLCALLCAALVGNAQSDIEFYTDPYEVRLNYPHAKQTDAVLQQELREAGAWKNFSNEHSGWYAIMSPYHHLPQRAWGSPLELPGATTQDKAMWFMQNELRSFGVDPESLGDPIASASKKHDFIRYHQFIDGVEVLQSELVFKFHEGRLIMFGMEYFANAEIQEGSAMSSDALIASASEGIDLNLAEAYSDGQFIFPLPRYRGTELRLVERIWVNGYENTIPKKYMTIVDAYSGEVLLRTNTVMHVAPSGDEPKEEKTPKKVLPMGMPMIVSGQLKGTLHENNIFDTPEAFGLPHLTFTLGGQAQTTDEDGGFISNVTGPATAEIELSGTWCTIFTANSTPELTVQMADGYNVVSLDNDATIRELSAYRSTNLIHDHMKSWLPDFTGMDFSIPTNIDVAGECNAFYDGSSINFYPNGGGCNSTAVLGDVVFHEYGHGINDKYYQSVGTFFQNGAMNEGYADFWAMSRTQSGLLGVGFYDDSQDPLRRYDIDPKIYPEDLVGQVHADGEIICGAWYDTHLLMGDDWDATMELFVETFAGIQANTGNGNEGQAYTNVLLDALQADDDDGDLNNGTPNGVAIIEGFDMHGITLFAYAEIEHTPIEFASANTSITLEADADIVFPFGQYFDNMSVYYRFGPDEEWQSQIMNDNGSSFEAELSGVAAMTVIEYYFAINDIFGGVSAVNPVAANKEVYPNLPFFTLVGVAPVLINDSDDYSDFGVWDPGVSGDNATTGQWEEAIPVGSFSDPFDPSTIVAPDEDHTPVAFGYCFLTGVSPGQNAGVGENDVDAGKTTLLSPVVDMTEYEDPIFAYWRWYVNAPSTGANPGSDWWQVEVSDDGGSSWVYVENTLTQDISWRRNAFRVSDYVDLTEEFQIRFIASDSTTIGEYLDGGSLIEAALDDIVLYDVDNGNSIDEENVLSFEAWPNPAQNELRVNISQTGGQLDLIDHRGRVIETLNAVNTQQQILDVSDLPSGQYFIRYTLEERQYARLIQVTR